MLNGKLALYDVDDVEALCHFIVKQSGYELGFHEREDLLAYLVATCWELSLRYEPGIIRGGFNRYANTALKRRCVDWVRRARGRTVWRFSDGSYERALPELVSLEHRPDEPYADGAVDAGRGGESPLAWILGERDREWIRDHDPGRASAARAAA